jgi:hypothetical protein
MRQRGLGSKLVVALVVFALQGLALPVMASEPNAAVRGSILSASDQSPMVGAKLHLGNPDTGEIFSSDAAQPDGGFVIEDVPPATYDVGVELDGGLYVVETPLSIAPGQTQPIHVAINPQVAPSPEEAQKEEKKKGGNGVWNNPATAALIVLGAAIVIGLIINEATNDDDDPPASP